MLKIPFSETARSRFCLILALAIWITAFGGLVVLGVGLFLKFSIGQYTELVQSYDGSILFYFLVATGLTVSLVHALGGFLLFVINNPSKRESYGKLFFAFIIVLLVTLILELVAGIICIIHINHLHDSFSDGITRAMGAYSTEPHIKEEIDKLQLNFQCCGNDYYQDWFRISWQTSADAGTSENIAPDSVPFSCCDPRAERDCISTAVHTNGRHSNYDYKTDMTIFKVGCREALMDYFGDTVLLDSAAILIGLFGLEIIMVILARLLQTSMATAVELGDPTATSPAYLFTLDKPADDSSDDAPLLPTKSGLGVVPDDVGDGALSVYGSDFQTAAASRRASRNSQGSVPRGNSQGSVPRGSAHSGVPQPHQPHQPHQLAGSYRSSRAAMSPAGSAERWAEQGEQDAPAPPPAGYIPVAPPPPPLPEYLQ